MPAYAPEMLEDLKRRHVAFLEQRLTGDAAREEWRRVLREAHEHLLSRPLREVVDAHAIVAAVEAVVTAQSVRTLIVPLAWEIHREVLGSARASSTPLGDYVPDSARAAIDSLLEKRDLVPDVLVRKVFEQPAVEEVIHDLLYDALTQFEATVNPFFAEWGLPAILRRMPIGGSLILSSMEAIRADFDRRLEPEIRRFLAAFSRRAIGQLAAMFLERSADPKFVELRKNVMAFLYTQSLADLVAGVDEEATGHVRVAAEEIALAALQRDELLAGLRAAIEDYVGERGKVSVAQWLDEIGASGRADVDAVADVLWPGVRSCLRSDAIRDFLGRITDEFYDSLAAGRGV